MANKRDNLLYKLRKKGVRVLTRERTIFFAFDRELFDVVQVKRLCREYHFNVQLELSMSKTSNISYFNYLFNIYTLRCHADVVRLIHATISGHCSYNGNHLILDIIQCNHRFLSSFYKPLIILCNLWTSSYRG